MRFNTGILLSLLALESPVSAPAPQYESESESAVASSAAGSAEASPLPSDSVSVSVSASTAASTKACKAKGDQPKWAQLWGEHRRPRVRPSASEGSDTTAFPTGEPVPRPSAVESPIEQAPSVVVTEIAAGASDPPSDPSPSEIEMPSAVETAPIVVTATAIEAGASDGHELPASSQVAQSSPVASAVTQPSPAAGGGNAAPEGFESEILNAHNVFRATYGAQALVWNQTLADQGNAHYSSGQCAMVHSNMGNGENLARTPGGKLTGQGVLDMWADEAKEWNAGDGFKNTTGHFTQVVWKETTDLGCGLIDCGSSQLAFCEYQIPGNMLVDGFNANVVKS